MVLTNSNKWLDAMPAAMLNLTRLGSITIPDATAVPVKVTTHPNLHQATCQVKPFDNKKENNRTRTKKSALRVMTPPTLPIAPQIASSRLYSALPAPLS